MGTFAFGRETRDRVVRGLANLARVESNERTALDESLVGLPGPYRRLLPMRYGALPAPYAQGLDDAEYVVYCYGTPIAWVTYEDTEAETGRVNYMPDWQYSPTTTYYQGLVWMAWGDRIVDPNPGFSREQNRGTDRGRSSGQRYGRVGRTAPSGPPEARRSVLLDPNFADPDWTPESLSPQAETRDFHRVRRDLERYRNPAHP